MQLQIDDKKRRKDDDKRKIDEQERKREIREHYEVFQEIPKIPVVVRQAAPHMAPTPVILQGPYPSPNTEYNEPAAIKLKEVLRYEPVESAFSKFPRLNQQDSYNDDLNDDEIPQYSSNDGMEDSEKEYIPRVPHHHLQDPKPTTGKATRDNGWTNAKGAADLPLRSRLQQPTAKSLTGGDNQSKIKIATTQRRPQPPTDKPKKYQFQRPSNNITKSEQATMLLSKTEQRQQVFNDRARNKSNLLNKNAHSRQRSDKTVNYSPSPSPAACNSRTTVCNISKLPHPQNSASAAPQNFISPGPKKLISTDTRDSRDILPVIHELRSYSPPVPAAAKKTKSESNPPKSQRESPVFSGQTQESQTQKGLQRNQQRLQPKKLEQQQQQQQQGLNQSHQQPYQKSSTRIQNMQLPSSHQTNVQSLNDLYPTNTLPSDLKYVTLDCLLGFREFLQWEGSRCRKELNI